jgi:adhesin transport system outer membrane protein
VEQREGELAQAAARLARFWPRALPARPQGLDEEPGGRPASLGEALAYAGESHPLLAQGLAQAQAAEAALTQARAQMRPRVELQLAHQLNPYTLRPGLNTQLQVNMPVFDAGSGAAGVAAADAQARAARAAADEQALLVRERITAAWVEWQSALRRQSLHGRQDLAAQQVVEGYQLQFRLARRSLLDLLNIQAEAHGYSVAAAIAGAETRLARFRLAAALAELGRAYGR